MEERVKQLENIVDQLVKSNNALENVGTIPHEVESAMRSRIMGDSKITQAQGTQQVVEGGADVYDVTIAPAGFITLRDAGGVIRNIAYYEI